MSANDPKLGSREAGYEIWFAVVFEPGMQRAYWLRYTTFRGRANPSAATAVVWAARFDAAAAVPAVAGKYLARDDELDTGTAPFFVRIADCELTDTSARGRVGHGERSLAWDLSFDAPGQSSTRTPAVLAALPLPVAATHVNCEMRVSGEVVCGGVRHRLDDAVGIQVHIHGTKRVEALDWCYAPGFDAAPDCILEFTGASLRRRLLGVPLPAVRSLWLSDDPKLQLTGLRHARNLAVHRPRPGLTVITARTAERHAVVRAWVRPGDWVGYQYRDLDGSDIPVAQSDIASVYVEVFERAGVRWRPQRQLRSEHGAAVEVHGERLADVDYIEWGDSGRRAAPARPAAAAADPEPAPGRIVALGLTYAQHIAETGGEGAEPVVFDKLPRSWNPDAASVRVPDSAGLVAAIAALDGDAAARVDGELGFLPAMMDYEVELGVRLNEPVTAAELRRGRVPAVVYFLANDLSARSVQIMGEGEPNRLAYWSASKSFAGFLPVGPVVSVGSGSDFPELTLRTWVNGELRQECSTADLVMTLSELLTLACERAGGSLDAGDAVLTGTPSGVVMQVPRWKRRIGDAVLDRFGKLRAAVDGYRKSGRFCGPGDVIEVDGGVLGRRTVVLR